MTFPAQSEFLKIGIFEPVFFNLLSHAFSFIFWQIILFLIQITDWLETMFGAKKALYPAGLDSAWKLFSSATQLGKFQLAIINTVSS